MSAWWQNSRLFPDRNRVLPTCLKGTFTSPSMLGSSRNVFQHSWNSIGRGISLERALNGLWCRDRVVQVRYAVRYPRSDQQSSTNPCTLKLSSLSSTMPGLPKTHQSLGMLGNYPRHQWLYLPTLTPPNRAGPHGIPTYSYYTILVRLLYNIQQYYLKYDINKSIGRED